MNGTFAGFFPHRSVKNYVGLATRFFAAAFIALALLAPSISQAAPTGFRDGMFDCLGPLDWGCRVIGFLFETSDNQVTYVKDGQEVVDNPSSVQGALRAILSFFSNAILIIASLKLLYELIQMVAETAHTGQVGGKDANKLWAPIRLVVAIGLLVPLSSGLNSGQYIILTVAKWGSGLASQTWKLFAEKLSENQTLTRPTAPRFRAETLLANTMRSYACMEIMNNFVTRMTSVAGSAFSGSNRVAPREERIERVSRKIFGNSIVGESAICGTIVYNSPASAPGTGTDQMLYVEIANDNESQFKIMEGEIRRIVNSVIPTLTNPSVPAADPKVALDAMNKYLEDFDERLRTKNYGRSTFDLITRQIKEASNNQGWTSAGVWFLAVARAQGYLTNGGFSIPSASGPQMDVLSRYRDVSRTYSMFEQWLERTGYPASPSTNPNPSAGSAAAPRNEAGITQLIKEIFSSSSLQEAAGKAGETAMATGRTTIDTLLKVMDWVAVKAGLWSDDPRKAFGDFGGSNNPFGEIADFGYKKIRIGLDYMGLALLAALVNAKMASVLTMVATLFLMAGVILAFMVPLIPFIRFFFAILVWLGTLLEAMISLPFVALAHLTPKGEGFGGPNTKTGYYYIFQIFLRPVLTIFGLIAALLMFYVATKFLNAMYYEAAKGVRVFDTGTGFIAKIVFSIIYMGLIYVCANTAFKLVEQIPGHALRWMGSGVQEGQFEDHSTLQNLAAAAGTYATGQFASFPAQIGGSVGAGKGGFIGNQLEKRKTRNDKAKAKAKEDQASELSANRQNQLLMANGYRAGSGGNVESLTIGSPQEVSAAKVQMDRSQDKVDNIEAELQSAEVAHDLEDRSATRDPGKIAVLDARRTALRADLARAQADAARDAAEHRRLSTRV